MTVLLHLLKAYHKATSTKKLPTTVLVIITHVVGAILILPSKMVRVMFTLSRKLVRPNSTQEA